MRARGAGCPARLLAVSWLLLVGLQASRAANVTVGQDPGVPQGETDSETDEEAENDTDVPGESESQAEAEEEGEGSGS